MAGTERRFVLRGRGQIDHPVVAPVAGGAPGAPGHDVAVHVDGVDRIHHRDHAIGREDLLDVRGVCLAAVGNANLVGREVYPARRIVVSRDQLGRVMKVLVPTFAFVVLTQFLGLYVASFLLISGFMRLVGKIALWKSVLTAFIFTAIMFVTFDIVFDVIMPKGPLEAAFGY